MALPVDVTPSLSDDPALLRIEGPIATITLNRPAAFNAIDLPIAKRLEAIAAQVAACDDIRVLVIEGAGRAFCAGGDLQTIGAAAAADTVAPVVGELLRHYHAFITALRRMPKIVLASVHGSAAGAGLSLAFSVIFASRPRMPVSPGLRQTWRIARWRRHRGRGSRYRCAACPADFLGGG